MRSWIKSVAGASVASVKPSAKRPLPSLSSTEEYAVKRLAERLGFAGEEPWIASAFEKWNVAVENKKAGRRITA